MFSLPDPTGEGGMECLVFYPSPQATQPTIIGRSEVDAARDAPPETGKHPLAVISHGHAGSALGHHDLATALARVGYVVAAPNHPGDNYKDQSRVGKPAFFLDRSRQISALLDALTSDPEFGALVDPDRIVAAGYSMGGYTVLTLAGAKPDFHLLDGYCAEAGALGFCTNKRELREIAWPNQGLTDERIKAVVSLAPLDAVFDTAGLKHLSRPVFLVSAENDRMGLRGRNLAVFSQALPPGSRTEVIPSAGHFVFLAPCGPAQAAANPDLCSDPAGMNRKAVHTRLNADIIDYFNRQVQQGEDGPRRQE